MRSNVSESDQATAESVTSRDPARDNHVLQQISSSHIKPEISYIPQSALRIGVRRQISPQPGVDANCLEVLFGSLDTSLAINPSCLFFPSAVSGKLSRQVVSGDLNPDVTCSRRHRFGISYSDLHTGSNISAIEEQDAIHVCRIVDRIEFRLYVSH